MDPAGQPALEEAIRFTHGCEPTFVKSVRVRETFEGAPVWDGEVQVFDVKGHKHATRVYAWSHATEGVKRRFYVVLHEGPIDSPVSAVRASIVADARKR
jgi:hypothetical protein